MENKKIILAVDDQFEILDHIKERIEEEGYVCLTALTSAEALEIVKSNPLTAVILDLAMPDKRGTETLAEIKAVKPDLPVVMVTGVHDESEARKAIELGALDYITKPIDFKYLFNILTVQ